MGAGFFEVAGISVAIIIAAMYFFGSLKGWLESRSHVLSFYVEVKSLVYLGEVLRMVRQQGCSII